MPIENKDIQYTVGIEDLYLCMMKGMETSQTMPTYEDIIYQQTNITDLTISTTSTNFTKWASNKKLLTLSKIQRLD